MKKISFGLLLALVLIMQMTLAGCRQSGADKPIDTAVTGVPDEEREQKSENETQKEEVGDMTEADIKKETAIHKPTAEDIVADIVIGWNLGNSWTATAIMRKDLIQKPAGEIPGSLRN